MLWQRFFFLRLGLLLFYNMTVCWWVMIAFDPFQFSLNTYESRAAQLMIAHCLGLTAVASGMLGVRLWAFLITFLSGVLWFPAVYISHRELGGLSRLLGMRFWDTVYWIALLGAGVGLFAVTLLLVSTSGKME